MPKGLVESEPPVSRRGVSVVGPVNRRTESRGWSGLVFRRGGLVGAADESEVVVSSLSPGIR